MNYINYVLNSLTANRAYRGLETRLAQKEKVGELHVGSYGSKYWDDAELGKISKHTDSGGDYYVLDVKGSKTCGGAESLCSTNIVWFVKVYPNSFGEFQNLDLTKQDVCRGIRDHEHIYYTNKVFKSLGACR